MEIILESDSLLGVNGSLVCQSEVPIRVDLFLSQSLLKSRALIKECLLKGGIKINHQEVRRPSQMVKLGDVVEYEIKEKETQIRPVEKALDILYEDDDLMVINKPQGVVTHPAPSHVGETLVHYVLAHLKNNSQMLLDGHSQRPGIVHRLDKGTSGCIVIAKHREALERLSLQFKDREIKKTYEALVWGKMNIRGTICNQIGRDRIVRTRISSKTRYGREAQTEWQVISTCEKFSWVKLFPKTGRTHQLRVHLSELKHPIFADKTYGGNNWDYFNRHRKELLEEVKKLEYPFLHASSICLQHPSTQKEMTFSAPLPPVFSEWIQKLGLA